MVETFTQILEEKILEEGKTEYKERNWMRLLADIAKAIIAMLIAFLIYYVTAWILTKK